MTATHIYDTIVIGAGQSGLATAYYLRKLGVDGLLIDDQPAPGGAWRHVWPSMTLFSTADFSNLPGIPMPEHKGYPPASHVVDYLTAYEKRYDFPIERPVHVEKVDHEGGIYTLRGAGKTWRARTVVAATGTWSAPFVPTYPGAFGGTQWHSAIYPGPEPFHGASVAVVGAANSGAQIAAELTRTAEVTWYTRGRPRWMPDDVDGRALFHRSRQRALSILRGHGDPGADPELGDIVTLPAVRRARHSGDLNATPIFDSLDEIDAEHLIWCTGFRPALRPIRPLLRGRRPKHPGLFLVGYGDWTGPGSATLAGVGPSAKGTARKVADLLDTVGS